MGLEVGQLIDGKYRIVRTIGEGGMGVVYEGENVLIRRRVAIKVMIIHSGTTPDAVLRFEREAQAAGQIGSDHILEVLDLGTLATGERYMVMEYLDGETLAERITRHGHLTPHQIAPIARQFLAALASAHAAGIIHRDLKPENIFILRSKAGRSDFVKLIDFGVSKFAGTSHGARTTQAGAVLGTPCYMSPEQARGKGETDVRSDIYACGVILYEAVTGKLPFEGESFNDLMFKIALSETPSPLTVMPALDPGFAWIIERAMARDANGRFQTVQEFSDKLDDWMRTNALTVTLAQPLPAEAFPQRVPSPAGPVAAEPAHSADTQVDVRASTGSESWAHSHTTSRSPFRRRGAMLMAASALVVLVVIIATLATRSASSSAAVAASSPHQAAPPPSVDAVNAPPSTSVATLAPEATTTATAAATATATAGATAPVRAGVGPVGHPSKPRTSGAKPATSSRPLDFGY